MTTWRAPVFRAAFFAVFNIVAPPWLVPSDASQRNVRCVIAQAFCSQKSFRKITLNYAKVR